ncbi:vascular endothelial growth factor receptor 3 [Onychostoma macrolepis]|nr:vascular endothelial growth factor receptor 3 [Onychostoma macrolepis]
MVRSFSETQKSRSFKMKGYIFITVLAFNFLQRSSASLEVNGPTEPILEGQDVTLECVDTESQLNMSTVHFERFSKYMKRWYRLESDQAYFYRRCFLYDVDVRREEGRLLLFIASIQSWSEGPYRCVTEDSSAADNSSQPLTIPIHYMREVAVHRAGLGYLTRYFNSVQDLKIRLGDDVELECSTSASEAPEYFWAKEGEDWLLPSNKLKLKKVREQDGGRFTCSAQSPTVRSLMKKRTISITVLPEDAAWYETTTGHIFLMVSGAVLVLLVVVISMTTYLCRRARQRKSKGPIDDRSQKKPIYRASVESLPSTASDKQPLV